MVKSNFIFVIIMLPFLVESEKLLTTAYQSLKGEEKQAYIWENIVKSEYKNILPVSPIGGADLLNLFNINFLSVTISHTSDEMPQKRNRIIHTYGSVAKFIFIPEKTKYTGLFSNNVYGVIRFSVVRLDRNNLMPGIALKFLIDGKPSLNIVALNNIDGQGKNYNFFENEFTNIIPQPTSSFMRNVLSFFTKAAKLFTPDGDATKVSIFQFGKINPDGSAVENPISPEQIFFVPTKEVQQDKNDSRDFRIKLKEIKENATIFDVYCKDSVSSNERIKIGIIKLMGPIVPSEYGDKKIFFQHMVK